MSAPRGLLAMACIAGLVASASAQSLDYRSIAETAVLYDGPSTKAKPLFVIARSTPVEVVSTAAGWCKVRDANGGRLAFVEQRLLSEQRTLTVKVARAQVREQPDEAAAISFEAAKDVIVDLVDAAPPGWAKVRHRDGQVGYVRANQVWGL